MRIELEEIIVEEVKIACKGIQVCEKLCPGNRKKRPRK